MAEPATGILIVDDHQMFRDGVRHALETERDFRVLGEASDADSALAVLRNVEPDILMLDISLPGMSGIELARKIRRGWPRVKILVVSAFDFDQYVRTLVQIGIRGYLLKESPQSELIDALRTIAAGDVVLPPRIASKVMRDFTRRSPAQLGTELTRREIEVLDHVSQGFKNADIAGRLGISHRTVESHVANVLAKLGATSRTEAARVARERGLIV